MLVESPTRLSLASGINSSAALGCQAPSCGNEPTTQTCSCIRTIAQRILKWTTNGDREPERDRDEPPDRRRRVDCALSFCCCSESGGCAAAAVVAGRARDLLRGDGERDVLDGGGVVVVVVGVVDIVTRKSSAAVAIC